MSTVGDVRVNLGLNVQDFQRGLQDAEKNMKNIGKGMSNVGKSMFKAVSLPLIGIGAGAIKTGMDFEKSMAKVSAVSGATEKEFNSLEAEARNLGATTKYSANEVADGMGFLAQAGFKTNDILASTADVLNLATISGLDLASTADITSNIMSGMGMSADQTGRMVDYLAEASANSNVDVAMLGETFKYVAPIANTLDIGMGDLTASIGLLGDAGIQGGQAGTSLAMGISKLAGPVGKGAKDIERLGLEFFDAEGKMKSMPDVIRELERGLGDMSDQQQVATLKNLVGQEAFKSFSTLMEAGGDTLEEYSGQLDNATGAGEEMALIMGDTLYGRIDGLKSALGDVGITIYKALEEPLKKVTEVMTEAVRWFGQLDEKTIGIAMAIAGVAIVVPTLLIVMGFLVTMIGSAIGVFAGLSLTMVAVVAGIALLVAGFIVAYKESETFRDLVHKAFTAIKNVAVEIFTHVASFVVEKIQEIKDFWDENGEAIKKAFVKTVNAIGKVFDVVFPIIVSIVKETINNVMGFIDGLITFIKGFIKVVTGVINGDWAMAWEGLKEMVSGAVQVVWNFVQLWIVGKVLKIFKGFGGKIKSATKDVSKKMIQPFKDGYNKIKGWVKKIKESVGNMFKTKIKKPTFSFTGSLNPAKWATGGLPKLGINWNAKGNIITGASILGGGQGVGEAGPEIVMPIGRKRYMKPYASMVADLMVSDKNHGDGGNIVNNFTIESVHVREEADIEKIATELERKQRKQRRAKGEFAY